MMAKAFAQHTLDAIAGNRKFDVLFGDDQTEAGLRQLVGMSEEQQFLGRNFKAGVIKNLLVVAGVQQP